MSWEILIINTLAFFGAFVLLLAVTIAILIITEMWEIL